MFVLIIKNVILIYLWILVYKCTIGEVNSLRSRNLKGIFIFKNVSYRTQLLQHSTRNPCFIHHYAYNILNNKDNNTNSSNKIKPLSLFETYEENFHDPEYNFPLYEKKWQRFWENTKLFQTQDPNEKNNEIENDEFNNYLKEPNFEGKKLDSNNGFFNSLKNSELFTHPEDSSNNQNTSEYVQCLTSNVSTLSPSRSNLEQVLLQSDKSTSSVNLSNQKTLKVESCYNDNSETSSNKPKYYILSMIPYPSGKGLHVGHLLGYTVVDVIARYKRFRNFNVLNPIGFDCFGIPTEIYSEKVNKTPEQVTKENVSNFRNQLKSMGFSFDFTRELLTCDPSYYKWTQWIFQQMYLNNLAYQDKDYVNYCPGLGSELSNEEVKDGKSTRGDFDVFKRLKTMWKLRITEYAKRLHDDLQYVDYPERLVNLQKNWIKPTKGYLVKFLVYDPRHYVDYDDVYSNNNEPCNMINAKQFERKKYKNEFFVDGKYLYGFVEDLKKCQNIESLEVPVLLENIMDYCSSDKKEEVKLMLNESLKMSNVELAMEKNRKKVFSGLCAINPYNRGRMPIYITNSLVNTNKDVNCKINSLETELGSENIPNRNLSSLTHLTSLVDPDFGIEKDSLDLDYNQNKSNINNDTDNNKENKNNNNMFDSDQSNSNNNMNYYDNVTDTGYIKTRLSTYDDEYEDELDSVDQESVSGSADWYREYLRFNMKDWVFSRNRGWGEPIPILSKNNEYRNEYQDENNSEEQNENVCVTFNNSNRDNNSNSNIDTSNKENKEKEKEENKKENMYSNDKLNRFEQVEYNDDKKEELFKELPLVLNRSITETMPQWAGSCWHFLRFVDPRNSEEPFSKKLANYWLPVDLYVGGVEHAVSHLLYSRFWNKFLYDINVSPVSEPFKKILLHGVIKTVRYYLTKPYYEKLDLQTKLDIIEYNRLLESENKENNNNNTDNNKENNKNNTSNVYNSTNSETTSSSNQNYYNTNYNNYGYKMGDYSYCGPFRASNNMYSNESVDLPDVFGDKEEIEVPPEIVMKYKNKYVIAKNKEIELKIKMKKMSKSRGNVISPEEVTKKFGSDALRLHLMFLGPVDKDKVWSVDSIQGVYRLLKSVNKFYLDFLRYSRYNYYQNSSDNNTNTDNSDKEKNNNKEKENNNLDKDIAIEVNRFIDNVTSNMENVKLNKISEFFDFLKMMQKWHKQRRLTFKVLDVFLIMFNPYAPHLTEHLWYLKYLHNLNFKGNFNSSGSSELVLNSHNGNMGDEVEKDYKSISLESWPTKFNVI